MILENFFQKLGLDAKETKVFMSALRLGSQPSSVIAKHAKMDRTTTYRILQQLVKRKLLSHSHHHGVSVFYVEKLSDIAHYVSEQKRRFLNLEHEFKNLEPQISGLRSGVQALPHIHIYDGYEQLENFYRDIVTRAVLQKLLLIRILGSNTFSQKLEQKELGEMSKNFEKALKKNAIESDILIAQGNLTREWLTQLSSFGDMAKLPAAGGATNVILAGESVFMVSFRDFPVGIRIDHPDIAQTMHFLFDVARGKVK